MEMLPQRRLLLLPPEHLWGGGLCPTKPSKRDQGEQSKGVPGSDPGGVTSGSAWEGSGLSSD